MENFIKQSVSKRILLLTMPLFALFFISCDLLKSGKDKEESDIITWKTEETKSYPVPATANAVITDEITKLDFQFPEGGDGTLTIKRVTSGSNGVVVTQDSAFMVEYTGTKKIQIILKTSTQSDDFLGRFTNFNEDICYDGGDLAGWVPEVPVSSQNGISIFTLNLDPSLKSAMLWQKQQVFKVIRYNKSTGWGEMSSTFRKQMNTYRETLKPYLPDSRQQKFYNDAIMNYPPDLFIEMQWTWFKGGPKYVPYYSFFPAINRNLIVMDYLSTTKNLAHEWGHYVSHILMGDKYVAFAQNPRPNKPDEHNVGLPGAKNNLIEEYAYLMEYFLSGQVGMKGSPEKGTFCVNAYKSSNNTSVTNDPAKVDYPDLEGFGATLFASIIRTDKSIKNYKNESVNVPVVAPSSADRKELFKICFEMAAQGVNDIYLLRSTLESEIQAKFGAGDLMPALLQPLGWSYHIKGKLVDKDKKAIEGATVRSVYFAGGKEYLLPKSNKSDKDGNFTLNEVFPGSSILRVYFNNDSVDVVDKVKIEWTKPTHVEINAGEIVVEVDTPLKWLQKTTSFDYIITFSTSATSTQNGISNFTNFNQTKLKWTGVNFSCEYSLTEPIDANGYNSVYGTKVYGTVSTDTKTLISLTIETENSHYWNYQGKKSESSKDNLKIVLKNIPLKFSPFQYSIFDGVPDKFRYEFAAGQGRANNFVSYNRFVSTGDPVSNPSYWSHTQTDILKFNTYSDSNPYIDFRK